jgi:ABC-2 type transport system permease protein
MRGGRIESVIGASLYIIVCTARNRARLRLRRLREPRYLLGALAGLAYLYLSIFRFGRRSRFDGSRVDARRRGATGQPPPELLVLAKAGVTLAGLLFALVAAVSWLAPVGGGLLQFSQAEVLFLYPAPVSRRYLLVHRMMRSQLGLLFASVATAVFFPRGAGIGRVRIAVAMWTVLVTARLFFTAVSLARPRLNDPDRRARWAARLPLVLTTAAALGLALSAAASFLRDPARDPMDIVDRLQRLGSTGVGRWLLLPFAALARPLFAPDWTSYLLVWPGALLVLGVVLVWVLLSDDAFQAAADAFVEGQERDTSNLGPRYRLRTKSWRLAAVGRPEGAFVWKAATETVRLVNPLTILRFVIPLMVFLIITTATGAFPRGLLQLFAVLALLVVGFGTLMGPQILRSDLRQDLEHLDLLKTWPVPPAAVIRGEILWPVMTLTGVVWLAVIVATVLSPRAFPDVDLLWRLSAAAAAAIVAPGLIAAQYVIHNGVALLFPAWVAFGGQRPRGLDAMGQRLILLGATWIALVLMTLPGGIAGALMGFVLVRWIGALCLVPAALACVAALLVETMAATEALGSAYERIDLTDVERAEQ